MPYNVSPAITVCVAFPLGSGAGVVFATPTESGGVIVVATTDDVSAGSVDFDSVFTEEASKAVLAATPVDVLVSVSSEGSGSNTTAGAFVSVTTVCVDVDSFDTVEELPSWADAAEPTIGAFARGLVASSLTAVDSFLGTSTTVDAVAVVEGSTAHEKLSSPST